MSGLLLDTCAIIYLTENHRKIERVRAEIEAAVRADQLYVSPISSWEIGRLAALGKLAAAVTPSVFFETFVTRSHAKLAEMGPDILIESSFLPGQPHKDPMDRILMTTARSLNIPLLTDDRAILAYSKAGHVKTVAC